MTNLDNPWIHLTNYSLNKDNPEYVKSDSTDDENIGSKWTLGALLRHLKSKKIDTIKIMKNIEDIVIKTIISAEGSIAESVEKCVRHRGNCSEIFGFDILLDENLKAWLIEVNLSPSLATGSQLDFKIKSNLINDYLNLIGIQGINTTCMIQG